MTIGKVDFKTVSFSENNDTSEFIVSHGSFSPIPNVTCTLIAERKQFGEKWVHCSASEFLISNK